MSKYIIKNCPAKYYVGASNIKCSELGADCDNHNDCLLKQIVEKCEQYKKDYNTTNGVWLLANEITNLLQIEEVE